MQPDGNRRGYLDVARLVAVGMVLTHHLCQYFDDRCDFKYFSRSFASGSISVLEPLHILVFMIVSGIIVLGLTRPAFSGIADCVSFEKRKLQRLMLLYLTISLMQLTIKVMAFGQPSNEIVPELILMVTVPLTAPAPHLWFLYVLMSIFLFWPLVTRITARRGLLLVVLVLAALRVLPIPWPRTDEGHSWFTLRDLAWQAPVFAFGYWYGRETHSLVGQSDRHVRKAHRGEAFVRRPVHLRYLLAARCVRGAAAGDAPQQAESRPGRYLFALCVFDPGCNGDLGRAGTVDPACSSVGECDSRCAAKKDAPVGTGGYLHRGSQGPVRCT